jgi:hypothetical protein
MGPGLIVLVPVAFLMTPDHFVKVFDVVDTGFRDWKFSVTGLILVAVALANVIYGDSLPTALKFRIQFLDSWPVAKKLVRCAFLAFALVWTAGAFSTTYGQHLRHQQLAEQNQCRVVEGPVVDFVPMPFTGHAQESFSVAGVPFHYSDYGVTDAFNNTASHGGPIDANAYVRICYDPGDNAILRLEIRGFRGEVKNYSSWASIFP